MSTDDENYEEFVKRYRASKGEPAAGPKFSAVNKQLALMIAFGAAFFFFTSWVSAGLDSAIAEQDSHREHRTPGHNPWSKD